MPWQQMGNTPLSAPMVDQFTQAYMGHSASMCQSVSKSTLDVMDKKIHIGLILVWYEFFFNHQLFILGALFIGMALF